MLIYDNHRIQTIFVLLQAGLIMGGSMFAGVILKAFGYEDGGDIELPFTLLFVRNWGFMMILIPLGWTFLTIALEQRTDWHTKRWTIGSGFLVLALLGWLVVYAIGRATAVTYTMSDQ